jgi:hypothetical protein
MSFVIRQTLAMYGDVVTNYNVAEIENDRDVDAFRVYSSTGGSPVTARRIIDARGLGGPRDTYKGSDRIVSFPDFMRRMTGTFPLRGVNRAAVIGAGDSARCAIESLLGIGPNPRMSVPMLDNVERVDAYGVLPQTMSQWCDRERGRYNKIGRFLRPDRFGVRRFNVIPQRALPVNIPGAVLVNGRAYDLVVVATGNSQTTLEGLSSFDYNEYAVGNTQVATKYRFGEQYKIGPAANLPFTLEEERAGVADIDNNKVSMFRLASKTAALAATLPRP